MIRIRRIYLILPVALFFIACSANKEGNNTGTDSIKAEMTGPVDTSMAGECPRGLPKPVLDPGIFNNRSFAISADRIGVEKAAMGSNGDSLTVIHTGCEYYILKYRFLTSAFDTPVNDVNTWYKHLSSLLSNLEKGVTGNPAGIKEGHSAMVNYIDESLHMNKNLQLGEEIDYGGDDIRSYIVFETLEKQGDKTVVEVSFNIGPL